MAAVCCLVTEFTVLHSPRFRLINRDWCCLMNFDFFDFLKCKHRFSDTSCWFRTFCFGFVADNGYESRIIYTHLICKHTATAADNKNWRLKILRLGFLINRTMPRSTLSKYEQNIYISVRFLCVCVCVCGSFLFIKRIIWCTCALYHIKVLKLDHDLWPSDLNLYN